MGIFDIFSKKKHASANRYAGNPFLKLVDSFVLDCIGELDAVSAAQLEEMEPKFREIYKREGTWKEIVMLQLKFPSKIQEMIRELWEKNQEIAKNNRLTLSPIQFVEMFVDKNVLP